MKWFAPYLEVNGNYSIISNRSSKDRAMITNEPFSSATMVVHANRLSREMAVILNNTSMVDTEFSLVRWYVPEDFDETEY